MLKAYIEGPYGMDTKSGLSILLICMRLTIPELMALQELNLSPSLKRVCCACYMLGAVGRVN